MELTPRIHFKIAFVFDQQGRLFLAVEALWKEKALNLALSSLMTFLFQNEKELHQKDSNFCYTLAKLIKKVQIGNHFYLAIPDDYEIALFFKKALEEDIALYWTQDKTEVLIKTDYPLPLTINVSSSFGTFLTCTMADHAAWIDNPLAWMVFRIDQENFCFCNGTLVANIPKDLEDFITKFLDGPKLQYADQESFRFIHHVYSPFKKCLEWQVQADFSSILPQEELLTPVLNLAIKNEILSTTLTYQYGETLISPEFKGSFIKDPKTGKYIKRMPELEHIYQEDLMTLFTENDIPFLLHNPGEIAAFLDKIVPILVDRGWVIQNHVKDFVIHHDPVTLDLQLHSSGSDWFYFSPSCEIEGQAFSLQELARLMVSNKGYLKTKTGFVKLTQASQQELKALNELGAFRANKKFNKAEILPLLAVSTASGQTEEAQTLLDRFQNLSRHSQCTPHPDFKATLRDYQQYGINWLHFLSQLGLGGILADDMGLGKTVQAIAFCSQLEGKDPVLVIGPTNVIYNWESEIKKFFPKASVCVYSGGNRQQNVAKLSTSDFIITTFGIVKNDNEILKAIRFKAIFVDEAQYIKNPQAQISKAVKELQSPCKIVMTGTPIENHLQDLWNLFDFIMPGYLGTKREFDLYLSDNLINVLKTKIKPFILRREKREVLDSLPEKTEIIVKCPISPAQKALYETVLDAVKKGIKNAKGQRERLHVLTSLLKLRQVCTHPGLLKELQTQDIESAKFEMAKETLAELVDEGHKIVLFSQFTDMLDIFETWTQKEGFYTERIDGSVTGKARAAAVSRFQNSDKAGIFLVSLKAGGVGINLTAADYVLHIDPWWNPAVEAQATDRVHRMGQQNKVIVYKFITEGTIEEKIQTLQESKKALLSQIIDIDSSNEKAIEFKDLEALLS